MVAISAYHISLGEMSMGKDPLVSRFLRGTLRLMPATRSRVLTWDFGHCPARPLPGALRAIRGGAGQVFDLKSIVPSLQSHLLKG